MLNPFDSEFLSQELRETWKKVGELEKENKELKDKNLDLTKEVMRLGKIILEQEEDIKDLGSTIKFLEGSTNYV